ncbi:myogenesis-regulating glycosidase [Helicoverpa armigera]|uniref:myogenesis-regulating glycosidase n=1 Tax=Helicoverpa armigera TaxID=29058 RepID=UPI003082F9BA
MIGVRLLALAALVACAHAVNETILNTSTLKARVEDDATGGLAITLDRDGTTEVVALVGLTLGTPTSVVSDNGIVITYSAADATLTIQTAEITGKHTGQTISLTWDAPKNVVLQDCVSYGFHQWYGGPQQKQQYWPIQLLNLTRYSYVTKEADNCGVAERYWLNSAGIFYYFDKRVPLFFDSNNLLSNGACFLASVQSPYSTKRARNNLVYVIAVLDDVRKAHEYAVATYLNKPSGYPDELMIKYPIWSTWARYKRDVSHELVLQFADEITSYGFPNSQFELDDLWEICYGSLTVNTTRFPSMKDTIDKLRQRGYRTTMWAHPFMNKGCDPWYTNAKNLGYIVSSEAGNVETSWWNNNGTTAAYVDFTKQTVRDWYMQRLHRLQNETGVDAYKFDGGETSWSPTVAVLQGDVNEQPNSITADYVRTVAAFGPLVEVRVGFMTQDLPIFVRMIDKDTYWTFDNGLPTLITTLFQMNINGYPLVLPDMIGGNGYNEPPSKELFIRWLQANTFMPSLQFSYVPWDYDNETIAISKKFVQLHADYTPTIIEACKKAVSEGKPVNMPIWWIAPTDTIAHAIWDEYLLGESILVAPIVTQNARSRDIYLPKGTWYDQGNKSKVIEGPITLTNYSAPLDVLPFFVKAGSTANLCSVVLVLLGVLANV